MPTAGSASDGIRTVQEPKLVAVAAFHPSAVMLSKGVVAAAESNRLFRLICTDERTGALSRIFTDLLAYNQKFTTDVTIFQLSNSTKSCAPSALTIPPYASNLDRTVRFVCIDCWREASSQHYTSGASDFAWHSKPSQQG